MLEAFDTAGVGVKAQVPSQLRQVVLELDEVRQGQGPSFVDDLQRQRAERLATLPTQLPRPRGTGTGTGTGFMDLRLSLLTLDSCTM